MPVRIPQSLPARRYLEDENIFVMTEKRALTQDIRPLKLLILNLMPKKIETVVSAPQIKNQPVEKKEENPKPNPAQNVQKEEIRNKPTPVQNLKKSV